MSTTPDNNSCFDNIIGLRGTCADPVSTSDLWINDIGISQKELDAIVTEDFVDGIDLFNKKLNHSINAVTSQVYSNFAPRYKAFSQLENQRIGYYSDNQKFTATTAGWLYGQHLTVYNDDSFVDLNISQLNLMVNASGTYDLLVYDLTENKLLDTIQIDTNTGEIGKTFPSKKYLSGREKRELLICYDPDGASYSEMSLNKSKGCSSCNTGAYKNDYLHSQGVKILASDDKIIENLVQIQGGGGISIMYSLSCNHREWICSSTSILAMAIFYYTAFEIMDFAMLNSPNEKLNTTTWLNSDLIEKRRAEYYDRFTASFKDALKNIVLPSDSKCFVCKQPSRYATMLP